MSFVHLHCHTEYSRLDGHSRVLGMAQRAQALGQPALAMTDHGNSFGAKKHFEACKTVGIKPIIGIELYLAPEEMGKRERVRWGEINDDGRIRPVPGGYTHLTVLARDATGLRNLFKLQHGGHTRGFYGYPRVDIDELASRSDGLIVLSGCAGGALATRLRLGQKDEAYAVAKELRERFSDFYIEIMDHDIPFEVELNADLRELARDLNIPIVATNDTHYTLEEDAYVHDAMLCLQTNSRLSDENRFKFSGTGFYLRSREEMEAQGFYAHELDATLNIAGRVSPYDEVFHERKLFPVPVQKRDLGLQTVMALRTKGASQAHFEQAEYELKVLEEAGYGTYIQVIADLVQFARSRGILVGPGRGSAAGSVVCWALGITDPDPLEHGLVFERFINPARVSPPDVDIDFQDDRRDEVFQYAIETYGRDYVGKIITFGTHKTRFAIKDAARVLGRSPATGQKLSNLVPPAQRGRTVELSAVPAVQGADPEVFALAKGFEGGIRSQGVHAAGLVISPEPLGDIIPVKLERAKDPDGMLVCGFEYPELEDMGLIKIDCLGLDNLTTIVKTLEFVNGEI